MSATTRTPPLTSLPTLDELIGLEGVTEDNVAAHLLELTCEPAAITHVYTLHAELEGMRLAPVFEQLLTGWKAQGWAISTRLTCSTMLMSWIC